MITRRAATAGIATTLAGLPLKGEAQVTSGVEQELRAAPSSTRLRDIDTKAAEVWKFDGTLAPVLRMKHGAELRLALKNDTPLPLSLHFHGVRGTSAMDGVGGLTQKPALSGEHFDYRFTPPDAGTFLIRPCVLGRSAEPLGRGLSGLLIVEEQDPPPVDQDEAILVDDWLLEEDGSLPPFLPGAADRLGNWLSVNGKAIPLKIEARPGSRIRLRLGNACNARIMRLRFDRLKPFVVAVDGQPTDTFEPLRSSLPFAPGTRYDVIVDIGEESGSLTAMIGNGMTLVELAPGREKRAQRPALQPIPSNKKLPESIRLQSAIRKELVIKAGEGGKPPLWTINGGAGDPRIPALKVRRGAPVVLALDNRTDVPQPIHLHGHAFRLLHGLDDGWEPYFLDTVQVPERRISRIAFVADNPGKWLLASTIMERFDAGLWTWVEVS